MDRGIVNWQTKCRRNEIRLVGRTIGFMESQYHEKIGEVLSCVCTFTHFGSRWTCRYKMELQIADRIEIVTINGFRVL